MGEPSVARVVSANFYLNLSMKFVLLQREKMLSFPWARQHTCINGLITIFSASIKSTTNQVVRGMGSASHPKMKDEKLRDGLNRLKASGSVWFYEHAHLKEDADPRKTDDMGESWVAERDLLEIMLIAKYAPPFNIKAER